MNEFNEPFDVLISGSDQVWNPTCGGLVDKLNPVYYLAFADRKSIKKWLMHRLSVHIDLTKQNRC